MDNKQKREAAKTELDYLRASDTGVSEEFMNKYGWFVGVKPNTWAHNDWGEKHEILVVGIIERELLAIVNGQFTPKQMEAAIELAEMDSVRLKDEYAPFMLRRGWTYAEQYGYLKHPDHGSVHTTQILQRIRRELCDIILDREPT